MFVLCPVFLSQMEVAVTVAVSPQSALWMSIVTLATMAIMSSRRISHHLNNRFQLIIVIVIVTYRIITIHYRTIIITITTMPSMGSLAMIFFSEVQLIWDIIQIVIVNSKIVGILILCESQLSEYLTIYRFFFFNVVA